MTITTTQIRAAVVAEAVQRALRECVCLLVYEYKDFFHHTVWAVLTEDERRPQDSQLLCTINHEGRVESTLVELFQDPLPNTLRHLSVVVTFPIGSVQFNNVTITIPATDPTTAYGILCKALVGFEYKTDTFQTSGAAHELSEIQSTNNLFQPHSV